MSRPSLPNVLYLHSHDTGRYVQPYGHPVPRTLDWLRSTGTRVFRTDRAGDVVIRFEDPGIRVDTGRGRRFAFAT